MKTNFLKVTWLLVVALSCQKNSDTTNSASISTLSCGSVSYSALATSGKTYSATASVPYTGGNGVSFGAGSAVTSTGVTGLTATLNAGTLSSSGNIKFTITGTPSAEGTASFAISFGGQSCTLSLTVISSAAADCDSESGIDQIVCLANNFISTLSSAQQSSVVLELNLTNAKRWSNLPCALSCRNGLLFSSLSTAQQAAALALIQAASGTATNDGYEEFQTIRAADDYLGTTASGYGSGNYIIAFLGTPSTTGKWMLQFGGHHYAQNITYDNGQVKSITPLHEGVEPHGSFTVNGTTYSSPLGSELTAVQNMLASFSTNELSTAKISTTFSDCLMVPGSTTNTFPSTKQGIQVGILSSTSQAYVLAAIAEWVNDVDPTSAAEYLSTYQNELSDTYVTYSSNTNGTAGNASSFFTTNTDYVRIDGPSVWIEFICQNGVVISGQIHY
ncbi:MAG: DUF3500 domain-containing protein, partial [Cyclobacteriaceae bacterium]